MAVRSDCGSCMMGVVPMVRRERCPFHGQEVRVFIKNARVPLEGGAGLVTHEPICLEAVRCREQYGECDCAQLHRDGVEPFPNLHDW